MEQNSLLKTMRHCSKHLRLWVNPDVCFTDKLLGRTLFILEKGEYFDLFLRLQYPLALKVP